MILSVDNVTKTFGPRVLFADASLRDYISIAPDVAALETTLRAALS